MFLVAGLSDVYDVRARPHTLCAHRFNVGKQTLSGHVPSLKKSRTIGTGVGRYTITWNIFSAVRANCGLYVSSSLKRPIMVILSSDYGHTPQQ